MWTLDNKLQLLEVPGSAEQHFLVEQQLRGQGMPSKRGCSGPGRTGQRWSGKVRSVSRRHMCVRIPDMLQFHQPVGDHWTV